MWASSIVRALLVSCPTTTTTHHQGWHLSRASMRPSLCSSVAWALFLVIPCSIAILEGPLQSFAFSSVAWTAPDDCASFIVGWRRLPRASMRMSLCPLLPVSCAFASTLFTHLHAPIFHHPCKFYAANHSPLCSCGPREVDKHPVLSLAGYKPLCSTTPSLPDRPSLAHPCMVSPDLAWISLGFHWR